MSGYVTVTSVGGLLPTDLLDRVRSGDRSLVGTSAESYGLVPGERLNDQITRSWNRLRGLWESFKRQVETLPDSERTATALTRDRWARPLLDELGFAGLPAARGLRVGDKDYPISHEWGGQVAVHLMGARVPIDKRTSGVAGAASASPHGLVQEFLNRSGTHLWGMVTNGLVLRVLRDNASLTRQAYIEFDLQATFDGELFSEFVVLWLTCHRTRFEGDSPEKCVLEQWSTEAAQAGTRALDKLRAGVETAITALGEGFVAHPANTALRSALRAGELTSADLQHQVLRIVYRLLFLLVAESRDLLRADAADPTAVERYQRFYSIHRLRTLASLRRGTAHDDLWQGLQIPMHALWRDGAPSLGLAPLGSFLWSPESISAIATARLDNRHLLDALRALCYVRDDASRIDRAVDYRNLGAEELGSIYESLLELHAEVDPDALTFSLDTAAGNERKTTGSYYTPTPLIRVLLDSALDPVLDEAVRAPEPEAALLRLKVLDPAVGSGHFLIAAAHRIAARLASVRAGGTEPAPKELRHALREVISHCVYGIDVNPMAVELCKVSLWMEATEPGRPLSFLDHRIVCGNSLLGATPALIEAGVPDDAFKPLEGDDKSWVTTLRKRNKHERDNRHQGTLDFGPAVGADVAALAAELAELDALDDQSLSGIAEKEQRFAALRFSAEARRAKFVADAWCAAFVAPKTKSHPIITDDVVRQGGRAPDRLPDDICDAISAAAANYGFLHLHVAFPDVFVVPDDISQATNRQCGWNGGFDVVLGNPPWGAVEFRAPEFFASSRPDIAELSTKAARDRAIDRLIDEDPVLHEACVRAQRRVAGEVHLIKHGGLLSESSKGGVDTYSLFTELGFRVRSETGRAGLVVRSGVVTDAGCAPLLRLLSSSRSLRSCIDFKNRRGVFPGIHKSLSFSLITIASGSGEPEFFFGAESVDDLSDGERYVKIGADRLTRINPNTSVVPPLASGVEADRLVAAHDRFQVLVDRSGGRLRNEWQVREIGFPNAADDSDLFMPVDTPSFEPHSGCVPVYESKMIHLFDHRFADIVNADGLTVGIADGERAFPSRLARPRNLMSEVDVERFLAGRWTRPWLIGWRDTARNDDVRTLIPAIIPRCAPPRNNLPVLATERSVNEALFLVAVLSSFMVDYIARLKVAGAHVTRAHVEQLPLPAPEAMAMTVGGVPAGDLMVPRAMELIYTSWDLVGLNPSAAPFRWNAERRTWIRAEVDAAAFRLYGVDREAVVAVMETFPIVRTADVAAFGEYRTKRLILERFDAMAEAEDSGREYQTILDPPPAHPSLAHDPSTRPAWADWYVKVGAS